MKTFVRSIIPALLILLFIYAATSKLLDTALFRRQLYLQPFSHGFADMLIYTLPATEILAALLLCFDRTRFAGYLLSVALLFVFTVYIALVLLHYWGNIPCSCGGILSHMSWTAHLVFNCAFIIAGLIAIIQHLSENHQELT